MPASHDDTTTRPWSAMSSLTPNLSEGDPEAKREEIRRYFHETFDLYERLFLPLKGQEAFVRRADPLRHPLIFYYGHTAVFFINKLVLGKFLPQRIDPQLESMCAIGVDEMSWDDLNEKHYNWPDHKAVKAYRDKAREAIDRFIRTAPLTLPISWDSPFWIVLMGIEHERIHLETSSVLIRQLPLELLDVAHPQWPICTADNAPPQNELLPVPGGAVVLGKPREYPLYGWDNEYGHEVESVSDFQAARFLVSNGEYREFVEDGGYTTQEHWTEEGWKWVCYDGHRMPRFWHRNKDGSYRLRTMLEEVDMPWSWPVEVNQLEAKAFCNWKAKRSGQPVRLPTEAEWYRLLDFTETPDVQKWPQGESLGNSNLARFASSVPVDTYAFGGGFYDVLGNVWQHTETPITAYAGFKVHPLYDDFSTPTFDCRHNLIKGGSWISTGNELTRHSRYAFRRHFYQHAGFRYIVSKEPVHIRDDRYETDPDVVPLCQQHYGSVSLGQPVGGDYPQRLAGLALNLAAKYNIATTHALDLGCGVGRLSFELTKTFDKVTGIDPTARTIRIGVEMVDKGYTQWQIPAEGEIVDFEQVHLGDLGLDNARSKVEFLQADLANMKPIFKGYDLIVINGLLERSYDPAAFLHTVYERLNPGGLLIIACSNHWDTAHTERSKWLGGFKDKTGENLTTLEAIGQILGEHFNRAEEPINLPASTRIDARTYLYRLMQVSVWRRID